MKSADIALKSSHLILSASVAERILEGNTSVYVSYQTENQVLLVSPRDNAWFPKLHTSAEYLLKNKDLQGTRSVAIREILIDHEIDETDRDLTYSLHPENRFLKIDLTYPKAS